MGLLDKFITPKHLREIYDFDSSISQEELFEIAQKHIDSNMRRKAIRKLRNKDMLLKLSKSNNLRVYSDLLDNPFINDEMIVNMLSFEETLRNPIYSQLCVEKVQSESLIDELARSSFPHYIRIPAIERTTNKRLLKYATSDTVRDSLTYMSKPSGVARAAEKRLKELEEQNPTGSSEGITKDDILTESVDGLLRLYGDNPGGFISDSSSAEPVKDIGRKLNEAGGMNLMLQAHGMFSARNPNGRNLEMVWDGIGNWRG